MLKCIFFCKYEEFVEKFKNYIKILKFAIKCEKIMNIRETLNKSIFLLKNIVFQKM